MNNSGYRSFGYGPSIRNCGAEMDAKWPGGWRRGGYRSFTVSCQKEINDLLLQMIRGAVGPGGYRSISTGGNLIF